MVESMMLNTTKTVAVVTAAQGKGAAELRVLRDHYRYGVAGELGLTGGEKNSICVQLTAMLTAAESEEGIVRLSPFRPRPRCFRRHLGGRYGDPRHDELL